MPIAHHRRTRTDTSAHQSSYCAYDYQRRACSRQSDCAFKDRNPSIQVSLSCHTVVGACPPHPITEQRLCTPPRRRAAEAIAARSEPPVGVLWRRGEGRQHLHWPRAIKGLQRSYSQARWQRHDRVRPARRGGRSSAPRQLLHMCCTVHSAGSEPRPLHCSRTGHISSRCREMG